MSTGIQPSDLPFLATLMGKGSLSSAARELGITTAAASKRLAHIEQRIGTTLITRTTRRMSLTPEGQVYLDHASRILSEINALDRMLREARGTQRGTLRVCAPIGLGRSRIASAVAQFSEQNPDVRIELDLSGTPGLAGDRYDIHMWLGQPQGTPMVATLIASVPRFIWASAAYVQRFGEPQVPADLVHHHCIDIEAGPELQRAWSLSDARAKRLEIVKAQSRLRTNDEGIAIGWTLEGRGLLMLTLWDAEPHLNDGRLQRVLHPFQGPPADVYIAHQRRLRPSTLAQAFVDFVKASVV